jgi:hypothetical protein
MSNQSEKECAAARAFRLGNEAGAASLPPDKPSQQRTFFARATTLAAPDVPAVASTAFEAGAELSPAVFLERAELAEANGELIAAGVLMREAVRQQLYALAAAHGVLPKAKWTHNSPRVLANRVWQAELIDFDQHALVRGLIHVGNQAAHCHPLDRQQLRDAIDALRCFIESTTFVEGSLP